MKKPKFNKFITINSPFLQNLYKNFLNFDKIILTLSKSNFYIQNIRSFTKISYKNRIKIAFKIFDMLKFRPNLKFEISNNIFKGAKDANFEKSIFFNDFRCFYALC